MRSRARRAAGHFPGSRAAPQRQHHSGARGAPVAAVGRVVESVPHVGTTVTPLSRQSILDVFTINWPADRFAARVVRAREPERLRESHWLMREMDAVAVPPGSVGRFQHAVPRRHRVAGRPADAVADDGAGLRTAEPDAPLFFQHRAAGGAGPAGPTRAPRRIVTAMRTWTLDFGWRRW